MLQRIRWFLLLIGIVLLLVFSLANRDSVEVTMPFVFKAELPLAMLMLITSALGFVFGSLLTGWMLRKGRRVPEKTAALENSSGGGSTSAKNSEPAGMVLGD